METTDLAFYAVASSSAFVIEKIKKPLNISIIAIPVSVPLVLLLVALFMLAFQSAFLFALLCIGLLLQALAKIKLIAAAVGVVMAFVLSWIPLVGQILAVGISILILLALPSLVIEMFKDVFGYIIGKLRSIQEGIREYADQSRRRMPRALSYFVVLPEFIAACGLSIWGIYSCIDWLDGPERTLSWPWSAVVLSPWGVVLFAAYRRDTDQSPSTGSGAEFPIDLTPGGS